MTALNYAGPEDLPAETPVLIAGGGPSGLFLALDLASRGIRSTVIEPRTLIDPDRPRAKTTNARTMTHLRGSALPVPSGTRRRCRSGTPRTSSSVPH